MCNIKYLNLVWVIILLFVSRISYTQSVCIENKNIIAFENSACKYGKCIAIAASTGYQCQHCVSNYGDLYCWQHPRSNEYNPQQQNNNRERFMLSQRQKVCLGVGCVGYIAFIVILLTE